MSIFDVLSLFGGLALFLYGMRTMGDGLKSGTGTALKNVLEKMTNNLVKAFFLGVLVTALIQSSTATIVITSGLVAAGLISLRQSLGIIIGANVGTTVTGQIIRLLDLDNSSVQWLQIFKPSTLAPVALIIGIVCIMFLRFKKSDLIGSIAIGFGILFTGLLTMTNSVSAINESGVFESMFRGLDSSPLLGYASGAGVAFILQSSSATIGILQAFSMTGELTFRGIYAILVGIYLGDCVTTAIVCSIGAKPEAKRVGIVNILFNLSETVTVFLLVTLAHRFGFLESFWAKPITSGGIANTNTVFNLGCAVLLFPLVPVYERLSRRIVKDEKQPINKYADKFAALDPNFYRTPVLAFRSSYEALNTMFAISRKNLNKAFALLFNYDEKVHAEIETEEEYIDLFADRISNYLVALSPKITLEQHVRILNQYYRTIGEFEHLGDCAVNIANHAQRLKEGDLSLSKDATREVLLLEELLDKMLDNTEIAFRQRDVVAAKKIEPMEAVAEDLANALRDNHLSRLRSGQCNIYIDSIFLSLLQDIGRISGVCSNIGIATVARVEPETAAMTHSYSSLLHQGKDDGYNQEYERIHDHYFHMMNSFKAAPARED